MPTPPTLQPSPPNHQSLSGTRARTLLRKLRDANVQSPPVRVARELAISLEGCLTLDGSAEEGLRYRLRTSRGEEGVLAIEWWQGSLKVGLEGLPGRGEGSEARTCAARLVADDEGRALAPEFLARVHPETAGPREVERFMRRLVRGLFRAA